MRNMKELKIPTWIFKYENIKEDRKHITHHSSNFRLVIARLHIAIRKNIRDITNAFFLKPKR